MRGSLTWRSLEERLCGHVDGRLCVVVVTMPMAGWLPGRMDVTGGGRRSRVAGRWADVSRWRCWMVGSSPWWEGGSIVVGGRVCVDVCERCEWKQCMRV